MATKAQMEMELAQLRKKLGTETTTDAQEGTIDGAHDGLNLYIRDEVFACRRVDVSYQMMMFAQAQRKAQVPIPKNMPDGPAKEALKDKRNQAGMSLMDTMLSTVQALLKPAERDRFHQFMMDISLTENPLKPGEFQEAIGEVISAAGGQQGKEKPGETTSSPSSSSSETTNVSYADFSSDKAGVKDKRPANA